MTSLCAAGQSAAKALADLLSTLAAQRAALRRKITAEAVHDFARTVDALGYHDPRALARLDATHDDLVGRVHHYYRIVLRRDPKDAAALNNIGVFISNSGDARRARPYFARAARLAPRDRNIHENLRIADILMHKSETRWHRYTGAQKPGRHTLVAYFDAHGM